MPRLPPRSCGATASEQQPSALPWQAPSALPAPSLQVLRATGTVFRCWASYAQTVAASEMGASQAMLAAGYNIDCLMLRYQVGWGGGRDTVILWGASGCRGQLSPPQQPSTPPRVPPARPPARRASTGATPRCTSARATGGSTPRCTACTTGSSSTRWR